MTPLQGLKVIEFTHMVMGPSMGLILADLGAEVLKIEPPGGDNTRRLTGSGAGYFAMYNRNKASLQLDLKTEAGKAAALALIDGADIVIENFRPGGMAAQGLGYEQLSARNPGLIYCSGKGFLSGPYAHRTALDEVAQMMGGLAYMTGLPERPMRAGASVIDVGGAMFGVIGILAALHERQRTGRGQAITTSLYETCAFFVGQHMAQTAATGEAPPPMSVRRSAWAVYDVFDCADPGEKVFVGVVSDTQWRVFCEAFALPELAADASLAQNNERVRQRERILPLIQARFAQLTKAELMAKLEHSGLPFAPVAKPAQLFDDPQLRAGGLLPITLPGGQRTALPALPLEMNGQRGQLRHDLPAPGDGGDAWLRAAGIDPDSVRC